MYRYTPKILSELATSKKRSNYLIHCFPEFSFEQEWDVAIATLLNPHTVSTHSFVALKEFNLLNHVCIRQKLKPVLIFKV